MTRQFLLSGSLALLAAIPVSYPAQAQVGTAIAQAATDPTELRPLAQETSILNLQAGQKLMKEAEDASAAKNYDLAVKKLLEARQVFNQLSNFHQDLVGSFSGLDIRIANAQRSHALEAAQLRDDATYQLAVAYRAQTRPELSVPLLIQVLRSQTPTRDLGAKAYNQLLEIGFCDKPYPSPKAGQAPANPVTIGPGAGILSVTGAQQLMTDASNAVSAGNYKLAQDKLKEARQDYNQLSNFYQELSGIFSGIDNPISDDLRQIALKTAQSRDEATYQLALVHRAQNQPELAVPLLVQVIRSQQPTRDLGKKAYAQLVELGFADTPYPRPIQSSSNR